MPLRRSLTLWLGLLGLLLILGNWVDSTRNSSGFAIRRLSGVHEDGLLSLTYRYGPGDYYITGMKRDAFPPGGDPRWFAPYRWEYATGHFIHLDLPHWLFVLAYCLVWSALLIWSRRRSKRLLTTLVGPAASGPVT